jgi:hypothetical protein
MLTGPSGDSKNTKFNVNKTETRALLPLPKKILPWNKILQCEML